jgi:U3 small nucleolar ribonucleoprotein component
MKSAVEITKELNNDFEGILRQIILDKTFDDRERKVNPSKKPNKTDSNLPDLDFEKNKLSLAQMEEQKYIKMHGLDNKNKSKTEIQIEQIKDLFR